MPADAPPTEPFSAFSSSASSDEEPLPPEIDEVPDDEAPDDELPDDELPPHTTDRNACSICAAKPAVYNFTCCAWRFCSTGCYTKHKARECQGPRKLTSAELSMQRQVKRAKALGMDEPHAEDADDECELLPEELERIMGESRTRSTTASSSSSSAASSVHTHLSDAKIRAAISAVNAAPDPIEGLACEIANSEAFSALIDTVIAAIQDQRDDEDESLTEGEKLCKLIQGDARGSGSS